MHILFESHGLDEFGESEMYKAFKVISRASEYARVSVVLPQRWAERVPSLSREGVQVLTVPYDSRRYPLNAAHLEYMYSRFSAQAVEACSDILPDVDVIHRLNPNAVRFTSALAFQGRPFIIGPLGWSKLPPAWARSPGGFSRNALKTIDAARVRSLRSSLHRMYDVASAIALVNEAALEVFPEEMRDKCELTYEWIDTKSHPAADPPSNDIPVILYVGRMIPYKGIECLVDALGGMLDVPWRLVMLGDGPLLGSIKNRVLSRGLLHRVEFMGRVGREEVARYYAMADICCFPGVNESSGNVNVEAMSAGRPVIAADWAGPIEIVDEECGIRVPPYSRVQFVAGLEAAIRRLLGDEALRIQMGKAARARAVDVYDIDVAMLRFRSLYERAVFGDSKGSVG